MPTIIIATTTFYPTADDPRIAQALETFEALSDSVYGAVVVDGGSHQSFLDAAAKFPNLIIEAEEHLQTMGAGRRQAMRLASEYSTDNGIVLWMEPEKTGLVPFIPNIIQPIFDGEAQLVVPARKSLDSYPLEQTYAEMLGNKAFADLTGRELDAWFGPRAMDATALGFFLVYDGMSADGKTSYGDKWDSIFVPLVHALRAGLDVASVVVDYMHPAQQKLDEEGNVDMLIKRIKQLDNLVPMLQNESQLLGLVPA